MKPDQHEAEEIKQMLQKYWNSYFTGDLEAWASFLPDHFHNIGTTPEEILNSKQEVVAYTRSVIHQMVGTVEVRNKVTDLFPLPPYIMAHEFGDLYIKTSNEWSFYAKLRVSSLLHHTAEGWKILHQHGSLPDRQTQAGESIAIDKISAENLALRDAVKRRTIELEHKNRELLIEASLEKVRVFALSMQRPDDMTEVCQAISDQLLLLGVGNIRNVQTAIINENKGTYLNYQYFTVYEKGTIEETEYHKHPKVLEMVMEMKRSPDAFFNGVFEGKELEIFREYRKKDRQFPDPVLDSSPSLHYYFYSIGGGGLGLSTYKPISEDDLEIFRRFHKVFGLAYRRFIDIQKAEAQAREVVQRSSVDRVRGQIAGMTSEQDLQRIMPLIWHELELLEVPFIRCGLIIVNEAQSRVQVYLTTPDVKPLGVLQLPMDFSPFIIEVIRHWREGKVYSEHWTRNQFIEWTKSMLEFGQIQDSGTYHGEAGPPETLYLHFVPFGQGMLYVGNKTSLSAEKLELVKSLADAFSVAYARYEDFSKLKKAKEEVEHTLSELKSTQVQLIHAEKMASLGELAAGIAHEIQNPLNFVNNFSEVNKELIDEVTNELAVGNQQLAMETLNDLKQNLEKINHHGQRADSIIKGMLKHSRSSSGDREPTDINALADEYLRLAYHGMRAKDNTFNAQLKTDFDPIIGKPLVVPQDIGRVILNLINNALYAVAEKKKEQQSTGMDYEPTVTVSTKRKEEQIEIHVSDNGNGIPEAVRDKIFQPFFTTKPTGQGTGLGLSLSYDIITKGHGGSMSLQSSEGLGTEFIVRLSG